MCLPVRTVCNQLFPTFPTTLADSLLLPISPLLCPSYLLSASLSPRSAGGHGSPSSPLRSRADDLVDAIGVLLDPTASTKGRAGAGEAAEGGEGGGGGAGDGVSAAVRRHMKSGLYAHQFTALRWLLGIESMVRSVPAHSGMGRGGGGIVGGGGAMCGAGGGGPGALFRRGAAPRPSLPRSPLLCRGAVLADGMGLGKTVVALALIAIATPTVDTDDDDNNDNNDNEVTGHSMLSSSSSSSSARHEGSGGSGGSGGSANNKRRRRSRRSNRRRRQPTLVVCPLQVLSQVKHLLSHINTCSPLTGKSATHDRQSGEEDRHGM